MAHLVHEDQEDLMVEVVVVVVDPFQASEEVAVDPSRALVVVEVGVEDPFQALVVEVEVLVYHFRASEEVVEDPYPALAVVEEEVEVVVVLHIRASDAVRVAEVVVVADTFLASAEEEEGVVVVVAAAVVAIVVVVVVVLFDSFRTFEEDFVGPCQASVEDEEVLVDLQFLSLGEEVVVVVVEVSLISFMEC